MSYYHLTNIQRIKIETYLDSGLKPVDITKKLGVNKSTLSQELNRCEAELTQKHYEERSKRKGRKSSFCPKLKQNIEQGLNSSWSPEQIEERYLLEQQPMVCFKTIYNWLYQGLLDCSLSTLRRKGKSCQPREKRRKFTIRPPYFQASQRG